MFQAQYLFKDNHVFSPWMTREGDDIRGTFDIVTVNGAQLEIELYEKNLEDAGHGTPRTTEKITATAAGREVREWDGVKEMVRFGFKVINGTNTYDNVLFRMLSPVWFDAVKA